MEKLGVRGGGGKPNEVIPVLSRSQRALDKTAEMDSLFREFECVYEIGCVGLTREGDSGEQVLEDLVLPRREKILQADQTFVGVGQHKMTTMSYYFFNPAFFESDELNLQMRGGEAYLVSDDERLSFSIAQREWSDLHGIISEMVHRDLPDNIEGLHELLDKESIPLDLDWDVVLMNHAAATTKHYAARVDAEAVRSGLKSDYHMHYHCFHDDDQTCDDRLKYSGQDLNSYNKTGKNWGELRTLTNGLDSVNSDFSSRLFHVPTEVENLREDLCTKVPYFNNQTIRDLFEEYKPIACGLWMDLVGIFSGGGGRTHLQENSRGGGGRGCGYA
ncbi:MAG: hypothetical protein ABH851_02800 [Methanobacteriota archaeon]